MSLVDDALGKLSKLLGKDLDEKYISKLADEDKLKLALDLSILLEEYEQFDEIVTPLEEVDKVIVTVTRANYHTIRNEYDKAKELYAKIPDGMYENFKSFLQLTLAISEGDEEKVNVALDQIDEYDPMSNVPFVMKTIYADIDPEIKARLLWAIGPSDIYLNHEIHDLPTVREFFKTPEGARILFFTL